MGVLVERAHASFGEEARRREIDFLLASDRESLMWFANMGCIEIHPFHSRAALLEHPDYAIFDLDPADGSTWADITTPATLLTLTGAAWPSDAPEVRAGDVLSVSAADAHWGSVPPGDLSQLRRALRDPGRPASAASAWTGCWRWRLFPARVPGDRG